MLDLKLILKETEFVKKNLINKNFDESKIDQIVELGKKRSDVMTKLQSLEAKRNQISKEVGILKSRGEDVSDILNDVVKLKDEIEVIKEKEIKILSEINSKILYVPNITRDDVPVGEDETANKLIAKHEDIGRGLVKDIIPHFDIATQLDIVDFERAVKLSGSRFWAYKGLGAKLERALENYMLDKHVANGYIEWKTPVLVKPEIMKGTGQLPKFEDDLFKLTNKDLYLIPTAEVTLTNIHANEILDLKNTLSYTGYTPCFRAEAGSGGRDTRGLIRAHQFNKVELVKITTKENVDTEQTKMINDAKRILEELELPYQEILLATGDTGFSSEKTIDLEVWIPSEQKFREISSISSMSNFQGRRAAIRYKDSNNVSQYAYTLNGSALAIDRTIAAILENHQNGDGTISIPKVLIPYMGNIGIIK